MWTPADQFPSTERLDGLIKEMKEMKEAMEEEV